MTTDRDHQIVELGRHAFALPLILAPMAGVSDRPFRELCRRHGADYGVSEMISARRDLWCTAKSRARLDFRGERGPRVVQIAGSEPTLMAEAARAAVDLGADAVDINMGCPAKKVCNRAAGSALLRQPLLVARILEAVCAAVGVTVTLKIRTGWDPDNRNAPEIARIAEQAGIRLLTVHGRTRACRFSGRAEYDTIAAIKARANIPVIANGDITSPMQAQAVLGHTGADGLMIGRAACGNPWIFAAIRGALADRPVAAASAAERLAVMREHVVALHAHYGLARGVRIARKHVGWYLARWSDSVLLTREFNRLDCAADQLRFIDGPGVAALARAA